jgi:ATP-dependent DNA ligase
MTRRRLWIYQSLVWASAVFSLAVIASMIGSIPTHATAVPDRPEWIHEIKHDGYCLIVQCEGNRVRLFMCCGRTIVSYAEGACSFAAAIACSTSAARWVR